MIQGFEVVNDIEADNIHAKHQHFHHLALVVRAVVRLYVDRVATHLPECVGDLQKVSGGKFSLGVVVAMVMCCYVSLAVSSLQASLLLNNLQALRVSVQALYEEMGGSKVDGMQCGVLVW